MTAELTDEQRAYVTEHMWAVLATGRADGSPQISMIGYVLDAEDRLVMSIKSYTAKWRNALRQPRVAIMIPEGRTNATIYGPAECIDTDPLRAELSADVFERLSGQGRPDPTSIIPTLDEQQRTVLRVTADTFLFNA